MERPHPIPTLRVEVVCYGPWRSVPGRIRHGDPLCLSLASKGRGTLRAHGSTEPW